MLRLESKQSPDVTRALWIPTIWMLYIASKPLGTWFQLSSADPDIGSPLDRAFLIVLLCVALWILIRRRFDWFSAIKENTFLVVLIVFMLVSILWSNIPGISFKRWLRELQAIFMAFVVLSEPSPRQAMESILRKTTYILIPFSLLLIKYFPAYGRMYSRWSGGVQWIGVALQKNGLGRLCLISLFYLFWSLVRRWQGNNAPVWKYQTHVEIFLMFITVLLMGGPGRNLFYAATMMYALGVGLLVYCGFHLAKKFGIALRAGILMTIVALIIIFGMVTIFTGASNMGFIASSAGRDATLTDRTEVWAALLPLAMQRPIIGSGYGGFWTARKVEMFIVNEAHSGYLDELLALGFVGILLASLFYLSSCRNAQRILYYDFDWGTLWICYLIMVVVHNLTESSIHTFTNQLTAVILFFSVSYTSLLSRRQKS